jgi:hypothetical protein
MDGAKRVHTDSAECAGLTSAVAKSAAETVWFELLEAVDTQGGFARSVAGYFCLTWEL